MQLHHKTSYKNISLLLKTAIVVITLFYIYNKLAVKNDFEQLLNLIRLRGFNIFLLACILLMLFNWLFEAVKWRILIYPQEHISIQKALKAILAGISISIFTPNRIGEFAGRIYYLEYADKLKATLVCFIGNLYQLLCTIIIGLIALLCWYKSNDSLLWLNMENMKWWLLMLGIAFILTALLVFFLLFKNKRERNKKIETYLAVFKDLRPSIHLIAFILSLGRYIIFSFQFYLLLKWLQVDITIWEAAMLIPVMFFLIAAIPTFALSELGVRGATAIYILGTVSTDSTGILAASLILWIINLALPALIGLLFVYDLNFFKSRR